MKNVFRMIPAVLIAAAVMSAVTGCSSARRNDSYAASASAGMKAEAGYAVEEPTAEAAYYYDAEESVEEEYDSGMFLAPEAEAAAAVQEQDDVSETPAADRKLIKNASMDVETEDFDQLDAAIESRTRAAGGYIESRQVNGHSIYDGSSGRRYASYTIRIPAEKIDAFIEDITGRANVLSQSSYVEDVTLQYVDTKSRITSLETQRDRLMVMLESAENVEDMITIESELTHVRYELERYASMLRMYDNQITYATLRISVTEVKKLTDTAEPVTVGQRIRKGISNSFVNVVEGVGNFFIGLIIGLPYLILLLLLGAVIWLIVRTCRRAAGKKRMKRSVKKAEQNTKTDSGEKNT
ncbi:MAG: DUF4349 domain-containing protein [Lachnospiraceae bacterium]|nr:DUF4349 domain-containing protein [Lachnospiraceae bacterium]